MTENITYVSRRDRRRAARKSLSGAHAASAGRATAAVLAASGLVISSGVAANATEDADQGRESSTVQLNASELTVERASQTAGEEATTVSYEAEAELSFERPAITSEASPERVAAEEAAAEQAERDEAAAEQAARDAEDQQAAEAQAQQEAEAQPAQQQQSQPAQQQQSQPAQQQTEQQSSNSGASTAGETEQQQQPASSGGRSGVVGAAYGLIGIPWSQMDCSAMVQNAYASAGISVPRDTYGQMTLPQVSSPAPGDIVISNGGAHAAIYIGNGQVISSTSSQGIRVHGLHESWHNVNSYHRPG